MIAKLAYLTTPAPNRFILNIQICGSDDILRFEIGKAHLANILIDGTALALRETSVRHRVPPDQNNKGREDVGTLDRP